MPEYGWSVDGVDLTDHAFNVIQIDDSAAAELRGEDREFAGRAGREHRPRVENSRTITLGMHVLGQDHGGTTRAEWVDAFEEHWRALRRLFRPDGGRQFVLGRAWTDDLGTHYAETGAIAPGAFERRHIGEYQARITADLLLSEPFYLESEVAVPLTPGVAVVVTNGGDAATTEVVIDFDGALSNPRVTNQTTNPDVWVKVGTSVAAGDTVTVDVEETTVTRESDGANLIGALTHSGSRAWFGLARGANTILLEADSGTGTATLRYRAKWM